MPAPWFVERLRAGDPLAPEEWDRLVREMHRSDPGRTPPAFSAARDATGGSSYELLAAALDPLVTRERDSLTVLDLACGDGAALAAVAARFPGRIRGLGVDRCSQELGRARQRQGADLVVGAAEQLPLRGGCCDAVVCHMALMLFVDLAVVVDEVARVLRPGGQFAAVVQAERPPGATPAGRVRAAAREALTAAWNETFAAEPPEPAVGTDLLDDERLTWLLGPAHGFDEQVRREQLTLELQATPQALWDDFFSIVYPLWALDEELAAQMRARLAARLVPLAGPDGTVPYEFALELLTVRRGTASGSQRESWRGAY